MAGVDPGPRGARGAGQLPLVSLLRLVWSPCRKRRDEMAAMTHGWKNVIVSGGSSLRGVAGCSDNGRVSPKPSTGVATQLL